MHCRTAAQLIALTALLSQSAGELLITPRNTESKVGETTYFNCSTNHTSSEIYWHHGDKYIYTGYVTGIHELYRGRFKIDIDASNGSYNLVIHSVQPGDAGEYICIDNDGSGPKRKAELVVLDNDPDCWSNIQPDGVIGQNIFGIPTDEVQLTCNVTYHGNIPPQMEWKKVGDNRSIKDNVTLYTASKRLIYTVKVIGDISLNNVSYVCQTTRSTQNQSQCTSEVIKVLYFIGGIKTQRAVFRGAEITCIASNNTFPCISQWYRDNYTCPLSCDETITTQLLGEYLCTLKCTVRGRDYLFEALNVVVVEATTYPPPSKSGTIAASVVVPIVIVVLVVLIFVYIIQYNKRKEIRRIQHIKRQSNMEDAEIAWLSAAGGARGRGRQNDPRDKSAEEEMEVFHKLRETAKTGVEAIRGVTILGGQLFIVREISSNLEVYDCENIKNFRRLPDINVQQLVDAVDICSCTENKCLYIMDKKEGTTRKEIVRISAGLGLVEKCWETEDSDGGYLSTAEGNVIITVQNKHRLLEYTNNGVFVRYVKLPGDMNPWHAIKLKDGRYIVSHGTIFDYEHKVCLVNNDGKVEKSFGRESGSAENRLNKPFYLAVASNGFVIVADLGNNRMLLLDSNLKFKTKPVSKFKQGFHNPRRIYLNDKFLVVVITSGDPRETIPAEARDHREGTKEGETSAANYGLVRETELEQMIKVDPCHLIEEDCRLLVFNIKPLLQKYMSSS